MAIQKCPICKKTFDDINKLSEHVESTHNDVVPKGWSGAKYVFYLKHGRTTGKCVICRKETKFNEDTCKPDRLCVNPKCKQQMRDNAKQNMIKRYGKETLLNDPEFQVKMLMGRSISKDYKWSDGSAVKRVVGSYEYDCLQFLDIFMNCNANDIMVPSPNIIEYEYEGAKHFYIPDIYYIPLDLDIECKDGGDNPNTHPKIQAVDKMKEKAKEQAVREKSTHNYVKVENKQYGRLIQTMIDIKNQEYKDPIYSTYKPIVLTSEMTNLLCEDFMESEDVPIVEILKFYERDLPIVDEIGLRVDDTIYVFRGDYVAREELRDVAVLTRYILDIPGEYKKIIRNRINMFSTYETSNDLYPLNFPAVALYEIFVPYQDISLLEKTDAYKIIAFDDYEKFDFVHKADILDENAFKDLIIDYNGKLEPLMTADYQGKLLHDSLLKRTTFPVKGFYLNEDELDLISDDIIKEFNGIVVDTDDYLGNPDLTNDILKDTSLEPLNNLIDKIENDDDIVICKYELKKIRNNDHDLSLLLRKYNEKKDALM